MNVAVLGLGFMGATHVNAWRAVKGARLAGVMSSSPAKLGGDLSGVGGNLGVAGESFDFDDVRRFDSVAGILADPDVDAVDICLPTDLHAPVAIAAFEAGKHVLVEKPMALNVDDAEAMRLKASRTGRTLMAGHVLRFIPAYRNLAEWMKDRRVNSAVFRRQCAVPAWSGWLTDVTRSGGAALDLLIHDLDFCISIWGMPGGICASGEGEVFDAQLMYDGRAPVRITGGWTPQEDVPFSMGYSVTTDAGVREWDFKPEEPEAVDPFVEELQYFADCVTEGRAPSFCPPDQSAQAVALARLMIQSRENHGGAVPVV